MWLYEGDSLDEVSRRWLGAACTPERLRGCPPGALAAAADEAVLVSALTCERVGADPPYAVGGAPPVTRGVLSTADFAWLRLGPGAR
jgi:fructokinase